MGQVHQGQLGLPGLGTQMAAPHQSPELSLPLFPTRFKTWWLASDLLFLTKFVIKCLINWKCYFVKIFIPLCDMLDSHGCS